MTESRDMGINIKEDEFSIDDVKSKHDQKIPYLAAVSKTASDADVLWIKNIVNVPNQEGNNEKFIGTNCFLIY